MLTLCIIKHSIPIYWVRYLNFDSASNLTNCTTITLVHTKTTRLKACYYFQLQNCYCSYSVKFQFWCVYLGLLYATSAGIIDIGRCTWQCNDSSIHSLSVALNSYICSEKPKYMYVYRAWVCGTHCRQRSKPMGKKRGQFESLGLWDWEASRNSAALTIVETSVKLEFLGALIRGFQVPWVPS